MNGCFVWVSVEMSEGRDPMGVGGGEELCVEGEGMYPAKLCVAKFFMRI